MSGRRFADVRIDSSLSLSELEVGGESGSRERVSIREAGQVLFPQDPSDHRHEWLDPAGTVTLIGARVGDAHFLKMPGVGEFRLHERDGIDAWREPEATAESLRHALLDQVLPRWLAHCGRLMLHGGAVVIDDDRCIVMIGDSGRGKSTLSAALARDGARLLTDDCVLLDVDGQGVRALATYPGLRLLPDSLQALYGEQIPQSTPVAHYTAKRRVVHADDGVAAPVTVGAVVILQAPPVDEAVRIESIPSAAACMELVRNAFQLDMGDMARASAQLARAAEVVRRVPVFTLSYPRRYDILSEVVARLRALLATPSSGAGA